MVCHRTWRACSGSFRKRKKNVINVAFECIRCIYIYKADHPRCKFIGLRFLSCIFLSKKKASTEGANIFAWGLVYSIQQGRLWFSFAPSVFPGLIIGRKFSKLRQSTAFYSEFRTISGVKKFLSGTYFFFATKLENKLSKSEVQNNILKIISARKKVGEIFLLDYPSIIYIPSLNYG